MNDKSIWYREVLEIEPQSRLFYPLARTLAAEGSLQEAKNVLEKGLSYHGHFVQARMLLCEVLQKLGIKDEAEKHFSLVAAELEGSASFWQAFAGTGTKTKDESLVRRLLALQLHHVPAEFSDIVSRGLDSLEKEYGLEAGSAFSTGRVAATPKEAAPEVAPEAQPEPVHEPVLKPVAKPAVQTVISHAPEASARPATREPAFGETVTYTAQPVVPHAITCSLLNPIRQAQSQAAGQAASQAASQARVQEVVRNMTLSDGLPGLNLESTPARACAKPDTARVSMQQTEPEESRPEKGMQEDGMQAWPPRTRSMAEVFAEQGEYAEAVSIYQDLIARAKAKEEAAGLQKRLAEIEAMAGLEHGTAPDPCLVLEESADEPSGAVQDATMKPVQDAPTEAPCAHDTSDELLGLLENLACRVEARIH